MADTQQVPIPTEGITITSMEEIQVLRAKVSAGEEVTEEELKAAIAFLRQSRQAVPSAAAKASKTKPTVAPSMDIF